jgi:hypothetical protein
MNACQCHLQIQDVEELVEIKIGKLAQRHGKDEKVETKRKRKEDKFLILSHIAKEQIPRHPHSQVRERFDSGATAFSKTNPCQC